MTGTTWDAANKSANISLGRLNLAAQTNAAASTWKSVKSTTSKSSGKWYFEVTCTSRIGNGFLIGLGNASASLTTFAGNDANSFGYQATGNIWGQTGGGVSFVEGAVVGIAVDIDNKKVWCRTSASSNWNGSGTPNPATGVSGNSFTASGPFFIEWSGFGATGSSQDSVVLNTGAFPFVIGAPMGFSPWDSGAVTGAGLAGTHGPTTWDPSNKNANISLSGGNLVATQNGATSTWCALFSSSHRDSGQVYAEFEITTYDGGGGWMFGFGDAGVSIANGQQLGAVPQSIGFQVRAGTFTPLTWWNNSTASPVSDWYNNTNAAQGDIVAIALDLNKGLAWAREVTRSGNWNNNASADPATGIGGFPITPADDIYLMWAGDKNTTADAVTANFGVSNFVGSVPSGYTAWDAPPAVVRGTEQTAVTLCGM